MTFSGTHNLTEKAYKELLAKTIKGNESISSKIYIDVTVFSIGLGYSLSQHDWVKDFENAGITVTEDQKTAYDDFITDINKIQNNSSLSEALWDKNTKKIKQFIPSKFSSNVRLVVDHTPLHYASYLNDANTIEYLLLNGAKVDAEDIQGHTPLYYAIDNNATEAAKILLKHNADVKQVRYLTKSDRFIDPHSEGYPALFRTTCTMNYKLTALLLESNTTDKNEKYQGWNVYDNLYCCVIYGKKLNDNEIQKMRDFLSKHGVATGRKSVNFSGSAPSTIKAESKNNVSKSLNNPLHAP